MKLMQPQETNPKKEKKRTKKKKEKKIKNTIKNKNKIKKKRKRRRHLTMMVHPWHMKVSTSVTTSSYVA